MTERQALIKPELIFLACGEPSGDALGAGLMHGLKDLTGGAVRFAGVGGERMTAEGLASLFPIHDLATMGLLEIIPRIRQIQRRIRETVDAILDLRPAAVVTIDAPGFSFRVAKRLRARGAQMPIIHYVAPQVWAWRPRRARETARLFDHLMVLLPFEPDYFEKEGLPTSYVGHPAIELTKGGDGDGFRAHHGIPTVAPLLGVLPGSRRVEIGRLLPAFRGAVEKVHQQIPDLHVVVPTVETVDARVRAEVETWPMPVTVIAPDEKADAFVAIDAALAASGTVTLELAMSGTPMVVAYRASALTAFVVRRLIKLRHVALPNVILDEGVIPERLQEDCTPETLSTVLLDLFRQPDSRAAQLAGFDRLRDILMDADRTPPSQRAAAAVLTAMRDKPNIPES